MAIRARTFALSALFTLAMASSALAQAFEQQEIPGHDMIHQRIENNGKVLGRPAPLPAPAPNAPAAPLPQPAVAPAPLAAAAPQPAIAPAPPAIDQRIENQQRRVEAGVQNGAINPEQAARDNARLERIGNRADALEARQGGELNNRQEHRMNRALNHNGRAIRQQRRN